MIFPKPKDSKQQRWNVIKGIAYILDKATGKIRERCVTRQATAKRRREIYNAALGRCATCNKLVNFDAEPTNSWAMHWHHKEHSKMGGGFRDDALSNAACLCTECHLQGEHHQF